MSVTKYDDYIKSKEFSDDVETVYQLAEYSYDVDDRDLYIVLQELADFVYTRDFECASYTLDDIKVEFGDDVIEKIPPKLIELIEAKYQE